MSVITSSRKDAIAHTNRRKYHPHIQVTNEVEDSMALALFAILMVLAGLIIRERGEVLVRTNPRSLDAIRSGLRASAFGAFLAILAMPWLVIGVMTSKLI